jgi:hypothetical protein
MADNQIVISDQPPQAGLIPKPGEKLWCVVTDNGTTYKISKICIANSDVWSDPVDFAGAVSGGLTIADGDKGDITVSGSGGTWTIDNKAVTFAKLADMATGKLLGRSTAAAGSPEVIDIDSSLALAAGTLSTNAKLKAISTAQTAASGAFGLVRSTTVTAADLVPVGATGLASIAATTQAEGRTAIGVADFVNRLYVQSRGQNLVTNGSGLLGTNENFTALTFDPSDLFSGGGSFRCAATAYQVAFSDELIPVDPTQTFQLSFYAKNGNVSGGVSAGSTNYSGIAAIDAAGLPITPDEWMPKFGTQTTLAAPLNPGDTTITLTSAANWQNAGGIYQRGLRWWPYVNSNNFSYPPYTYSRNSTRDSWAAGAINGNVITLRVAWTGPPLPTGTPIENASLDEGSYKYFGLINSTVPTQYTNFIGEIGGIDSARIGGLKFPPGTAFVKLIFLFNYSPPSNAVIHLSAISFTATLPANTKYKPVIAASQPNSTVFLDSTTSKLSFKDATGVVTALY